MSASTEIERQEEAGGALANRRLDAGLAEDNGIINVARWQMLSAIAETVTGTEFVPKGLRDSPKKVLACLLYGDALGMQPMSSLKEIHVIDGTPGLSAAAMQALVRRAHPGHRIKRIELYTQDDGGGEKRFDGVTVEGLRGDTDETDTYTFTLAMATRAGLMGKDNWKKYPEAMCSARALSQICTFLFPDVFMGSPYVPEEIESFSDIPNVVEPAGGENGGDIVKPPAVESPMADPDGAEKMVEALTQDQWEVADADTGENITYISGDDKRSITDSGMKLVRFPEIEGKWEIVGYEIDGATSKEKLLVRAEAAEAGKPAEGTPAAVVGLNIPDILGKYVAAAQERGDVEFIRGVLEAEKAGKARARLVSALEGVVESMEADALKETLSGDGTGDDNPLLDEPEEGAADGADGFRPLEDGSNDADGADEPDEALVELHPDIPFGSATKRAKVVRLKAFCAVMEDQWPEQRVWRLEGVVASAAKQWGGQIESVEDLDESQLEKIWEAAAAHAPQGIEFLALTSPADIAKMAAPKEQA